MSVVGGFGAEAERGEVVDDVDGAEADGDGAIDEFEDVLGVVARHLPLGILRCAVQCAFGENVAGSV